MNLSSFSSPQRSIGKRCGLALLSLALLAVAVSCLFAGRAYADVRLADVVRGESVQARDLSISQCPSISAEYAYVIGSDGTVYFDRNAEVETQIASITKVMTAIVALDKAELNTVIYVSEAAASIGESTASLEAGDTLTLDQALTAMMVSSGNDAALAIAETLGSQWTHDGLTPVQAFAEKMNEAAANLGMEHSLFENPHGLDFDQFEGNLHSSAKDVATMCIAAMENETFRNIVRQDKAVVTVTREGKQTPIELESTDILLGQYEGACGVKTGFTALAGACFAGACERNGEMLIAVVLNASDESQRFFDCQELWDWVYAHNVDYRLVNSTETVLATFDGEEKVVPLVAEVAHKGWIDQTVKGTLEDNERTIRVFDLNGNISQDVEFKDLTEDVRPGDVIGTITFKQHNEEVATANIIACESVAAPNLFDGIGIWFTRLLSGFSGEQTEANSTLYNQTPLLINKANSAA